jgi:prepilin-type processing-associated H-X9-DG protein
MTTDVPAGDKNEGLPQDVRNGIATAALVVGILALILTPVGVPVGPVAVVLAFVALLRARHIPQSRAGRLLGGIGMCLGVLTTFVSVARLSVSGTPPRVECAANLCHIGQALAVYANDYDDAYPVASFGQTEDDVGRPFIRFVGQMGANCRTQLQTSRPTGGIPKGDGDYADPNTPGLAEMQRSIHASRSLFLLIMDGSVTARDFICPGSGDREGDLRIPNSLPYPADPGNYQFDFKGYPYLSYGYQLPFGPVGRPSAQLNPNMPIMADKGPFFKAGTPRSDDTVPDAPMMTPGTAISIGGATTADALLKLPDSAWRPFNSRNHEQAGQNVLFVDGHVEWVTKPIVGVDHDNIYTVQSGENPMDSLLGRTPADELRPRTDSDSVIVP